ncbi:hypothetical protein [Caldanaerobacter sp.]|uniref:hypothetical protein n=1 Tax=Caldanaerobacter sp. TaxID=2930036 RepID=UPI003C752F1A
MANFIIEFTPFEANNNAQLITTATVKNPDTGEVYFTEPVIVDVTADMTPEQINEVVKQKTSGFAARVEAIELAKQFAGTVPQI